MFDSVLLSFRNIFRKGLRTAITVLGVAVGVASVLLISTISDIGIKTVESELDSLGLNGISVSPEKSSITDSDLTLIKSQNGVKAALPMLTLQSKLTKNDIEKEIMIWGVDENAKEVVAFDVLYGRSLTKQDINEKKAGKMYNLHCYKHHINYSNSQCHIILVARNSQTKPQT